VAFAAAASALLLLLLPPLGMAIVVVMAVEACAKEALLLLLLLPFAKSTSPSEAAAAAVAAVAVAPPRAISRCSFFQASTTPLSLTSLAPSALRRNASSVSALSAAKKARLDLPSTAMPTRASTAARPRSGNMVASAVTGTGTYQTMVFTGRA